MVKRTGPTNHQMQNLLSEIKVKAGSSLFWKRVFHDLSCSTRQRRKVNLYKIEKYARDGETIIVPGKVLSVGELNKKVNIFALNFSDEARRKIIQANSKAMSIKELLQQNPEGNNVRIIG